MAQLVSRLNIFADNAERIVSLALHDTANQILLLIRVFAPVDTGWLRDSYQKVTISQLHILIGTMVNYAVIQEYGSRFQSGTPHVLPAFVQSEDILKKAFQNALAEFS